MHHITVCRGIGKRARSTRVKKNRYRVRVVTMNSLQRFWPRSKWNLVPTSERVVRYRMQPEWMNTLLCVASMLLHLFSNAARCLEIAEGAETKAFIPWNLRLSRVNKIRVRESRECRIPTATSEDKHVIWKRLNVVCKLVDKSFDRAHISNPFPLVRRWQTGKSSKPAACLAENLEESRTTARRKKFDRVRFGLHIPSASIWNDALEATGTREVIIIYQKNKAWMFNFCLRSEWSRFL